MVLNISQKDKVEIIIIIGYWKPWKQRVGFVCLFVCLFVSLFFWEWVLALGFRVYGEKQIAGAGPNGYNEPAAPSSAPWRMDGWMDDKWSRNSSLLGSSSLANHGG